MTTPIADPSTSFADNLVHFARYLRARSFSVTPDTSAALLQAADTIGLDDRDDLRAAFRAVTVARPEELQTFEQAFDLFFGEGEASRPSLDKVEYQVHDRDRPRPLVPVLAEQAPAGAERPRDDLEEVTGGSYAERLGRKDFGDLTAEEQAEVRDLIARMVWQPADARSRRWGPDSRGRRPHFRRTFRGMVGPHGDLMPLAYADRRRRRRPLLVLADVSGSMERYSEMLLYFIHAAQGRLGRVEAFVVSPHLTRITREVRHRDPRIALRQVAGKVTDWSSGTRIGESLRTFNREWSRRVARGGPIALVVSDGWDRGDPDLLHDEMARLARSVHRVVWLNPLAGRAGFRPETRGMRTVLPFVDHFLSAASVADLRQVVRLLESVPARRREVARRTG